MPQSRMRLSLIVLLLAVLVAGVAVGILVDREALAPATASGAPVTTPGAGPDLNLVEDAYGLIQQHYVDRPAIQPTPLTYGAVAGMVDALGDTGHSRFLSPADLRQEQQSTAGQFEGIGAYVDMANGNVVIVSPIDGSPAQKAGLQPGDVILQVNGKSTEGQTLDQVVNQVLGPAGSKVTLSILTPATNVTRDVTITRAKIVLHNVTWQQLPGTTIAHLRIAEFSQGVGADLDQALQQIKQQKITGVVFDLRNDPGGLLDEFDPHGQRLPRGRQRVAGEGCARSHDARAGG